MIIICNTLTVKEGTRNDMIRELNESGVEDIFRSVPGCMHYSLSASISDENVIYLTDIWETEKAFKAHLVLPEVSDWRRIKGTYVIEEKHFRHDTEIQ